MKAAIAAALAAITATGVLAHDAASSAQAERVFDLRVEGGKLAVGPKTVRVVQGETVRLRWSTAEPMELHLHGYDVTVRMAAGGTADMTFRATATGRFPVRAHAPSGDGAGHHHGPPLVQVEVLPP